MGKGLIKTPEAGVGRGDSAPWKATFSVLMGTEKGKVMSDRW